MSLFERLKNKRYDLQESGPNDPKFYTSSTEKKFQGSKEAKNLKKTRRRSTPSITRGSGVGPTERINPDDIKTQQTQDKIVKQRIKSAEKSGNISDFSDKPIEGAPNTKKLIRGQEGETIANPVQDTSKKTAEKTARASTAGTGGRKVKNETKFSKDTNLEQPVKTQTKTRTVKQSEVSKQAQNFTKEINKKNKNRTFFDPKKAKEARKNLIAKRKEYGIDRKGNISNAGVERYARKTKQLSSGSNVPVKLTQADKDLAKKRMTDKYGRRLGRVRNKNMPSLDQVKKDIELRPYKKKLEKQYNINREQQRTIQKKLRIDKAIAKSGESSIKFRDTARTIAKKIPGLSKTITTPAVANKAGKVLTPAKTKTALKPIVKKAITLTQKAGPGGAIAAGTALALLNPSIRKGAKRIAKAALGAAGVKAFTSKPKLVKRPPSKVGINLSPKA